MSKVLKIKPFFTDRRGTMAHLLPKKTTISSALLITSKKGSIRANHYHKKDTHYVYLLKGRFVYVEKNMDKKRTRKWKKIIHPGELVVSRPMMAHAMKFIEDSVWIVLTTEPRVQKNYELDTVKIKLL